MNNQIFYFFYDLAHQFKFLDGVIIFLAVYLPWLVAISAFLFLIFHHNIHQSSNPFKEFINKWKEFFFVFFTGGFAWIVSVILKIAIHVDRPMYILNDVSPLFYQSGFAFPSQHTVFLSALSFALFFNHKRVGYVFFLFTILVGIARVVSGVHFPIDIFGGLILGYLISLFIFNLFKK